MNDTIGRHTATPSFRALLIVLSILYLILHLPFLDQIPAVVVDEPWYANTAHNLAHGRGLVNTNVGARGGDQFFLYPLIVSGVFKIFGTSLWSGRFVSVLIGLVGLWGLSLICRKLAVDGWVFAVTAVLFIMSNVYYIQFRRLRPEALVIALSVWALYFFIAAWRTDKFNPAFICALLAGSSALSHPYGTLLAVLLGLLLAGRALSHRGGAPSILGYTAGGVSTILIFLVGWWLLREQSLLDFLKEGLFRSRRLSLGEGTMTSALWMNLTTFVPAYSLGLKRLYILLFELGVLLVGFARFRHDRLAGLLGLTGLLWIVAGLVLWTPFQRWAFSIPLIFSLTVTGRLLSLGATTMSPIGFRTLWLCTLLYGLNTLAGDAYVLKQNATNTPYARLTQTLDATVPDGVTVLTPIEFWFAFQNNPVYTQFRRWWATPYSGLRELQESGSIRYVVLSDILGEGFSPTTGERMEISDGILRFHQDARAYALTHCHRVSVLSTQGYGEIEVRECASRPKDR